MRPTATALRVPADQLYWALLDVSRLLDSGGRVTRRLAPNRLFPRASSTSTQAVGFMLEREVPEPLESVHIVYRPIGPHHVLACAINRENFSALIEAHPDAVMAVPEEVPEAVVTAADTCARTHHGRDPGSRPDRRPGGPVPDAFNLMSGAFTSIRVRRQRARTGWLATGAVFVAMLLLGLGAERRIERAREGRMQLAAMLEDAANSVLPQHTSSNGSAQPVDVRLLAERRLLERTRGSDAAEGDRSTLEADRSLQSLLLHWPAELRAETELLEVTESTITLRVAGMSGATVETLIEALQPWEGWDRRQPEVAVRDGLSGATLHFVRSTSKQEAP